MGMASSTICSGWTVVTTGVSGPMSPRVLTRAYSRSEKPPPLPRRAPSLPTATAPQTMRSMGRISLGWTRRPSLNAPLMLLAKVRFSMTAGSSSMKHFSLLSRGTAM